MVVLWGTLMGRFWVLMMHWHGVAYCCCIGMWCLIDVVVSLVMAQRVACCDIEMISRRGPNIPWVKDPKVIDK